MAQFKDAHIDTVEVIVSSPVDIGKPINDTRVSKDGLFGDGKKRRVVIKGTRKEMYSFQTRRLVSMGECESVKEVEETIQSICQNAGIAYNLLMIQRVDFKFDLADRVQLKLWMKTCNLLIAAVTVMWKCKPKNLYCGRAGQYGDEKNNKAKHGNLEIEAYNKEIQKPNARIPHRLEIRCLNLGGKSLARGLLDWRTSLRKAKEFYPQATMLLNERLAKMYQEAQETACGILAVNDFIHCHIDGIFSREQLRGLYTKLGTRNPDAATKHYCERFPKSTRLFINKGEFERFLDDLCANISSYIG